MQLQLELYECVSMFRPFDANSEANAQNGTQRKDMYKGKSESFSLSKCILGFGFKNCT